jgi:uncharacterized membrane protein
MVFTPVMLVHIAAASSALLLGGILLLMRRGTPPHRLAGRAWVALIAVTALSSFFIRTRGHFTAIHLLSLLILTMLTMAIVNIRRRNIARHQRMMIGSYAGLVAAAVFTLLPGRRLGYLLWHALHLV